jgi:hypothetical protein
MSPGSVLTRWAPWFVALWVVVATGLLVSAFLIPFRWWSAAVFLAFGSLETIGLLHNRDELPPLTQVIRRYLARWQAFTIMYAMVGGLGAVWFGLRRPWSLAALFGLLGWLVAHFDVTYDAAGE